MIGANATYMPMFGLGMAVTAIALATCYMTADEQRLNGLGSAARARPGALPAGRPLTADAKQYPTLGRKNGAAMQTTDNRNQDWSHNEKHPHGINRPRTMACHIPADGQTTGSQVLLLARGPVRHPRRVPCRGGQACRVGLRP
jgi:hypothetical protein